MRKILATILISGLALVPAASAWASADGAAPADRSVEQAAGGASVGAKQLFAYGCQGGQAFALWITDKGNIRGTNVPFIDCVGDDFIVLV